MKAALLFFFFFFCQTYVTVWSTLSFFGPLFGFALRHSAVPLFLVQRLVPPNGHRCLNFNFAEGGRKKKKRKRERFIDFWTPPPSCFYISKLAGGKKGKKEIGDNSYMLHCWRELPAPAAEHTGLTFEDAHYTTLHSFPLSESLCLSLHLRLSGEAAFHQRSESVLFRFATKKTPKRPN